MRHPEMRRADLLEILKKKKFHTIEDLKKHINISHATIHRDLKLIEKEGYIKKTYGGVEVLINNKPAVREYDKRINLNIELKEEIAKMSLNFVKEGECIFLDASSTSFYFGKILINSGIKELTIITNSIHLISAFAEIEPGIKIISTGGTFDNKINAFLGNFTTDFISHLKLNKTFVSGAGFSIQRGLTTTNDFILNITREAIKNADKKYCLIDSTKFSKEYFLKIADLKEFDAVITDSNININDLRKAKKSGINLCHQTLK